MTSQQSNQQFDPETVQDMYQEDQYVPVDAIVEEVESQASVGGDYINEDQYKKSDGY